MELLFTISLSCFDINIFCLNKVIKRRSKQRQEHPHIKTKDCDSVSGNSLLVSPMNMTMNTNTVPMSPSQIQHIITSPSSLSTLIPPWDMLESPLHVQQHLRSPVHSTNSVSNFSVSSFNILLNSPTPPMKSNYDYFGNASRFKALQFNFEDFDQDTNFCTSVSEQHPYSIAASAAAPIVPSNMCLNQPDRIPFLA
uniref:Uncharacterized protein n=1 Tax=Aplanochytrium stocchinoi TaxID=215587 RepID=A0A7S3PGM8_9STRA